MKRVLVVYPEIPHYRFGVFKALSGSRRAEYHFAAAQDCVDGIEAVQSSELDHFTLLKTSRIGRLVWQHGLFRLISGRRFDKYIFVGDTRIISTWVAAAYLRLRGQQVFFWTIGWHRPDKGYKRIVRLVFYSLSSALLLYGSVARDIGLSLGFPASKMFVIGNSHDSSMSISSDRNAGIGQMLDRLEALTYPLVGAVIRLTEVKRLDLLVTAVAEVNKAGQKCAIVLGGSGPMESALRKQAELLGVELHFLGAIYDEDNLERFYDIIQVTVVPAAVGLTGIQSLAHGVPVISDDSAYTQMPEWEAIVPGETGQVYSAGDPTDLAKVVQESLSWVAAEPRQIALRCIHEVRSKWSPPAQVGAIELALFGVQDGTSDGTRFVAGPRK